MSYYVSQETRQAILDYLNENQCKGSADVADVVKRGRNSVDGQIRYMTRRGELEKIGSGKGTVYRALVKTTVSAEQVIEEMREVQRKSHTFVFRPEKPKQREPWRYVSSDHRDPYTEKPYQNQGGQGAGRNVVGVQSSFNVV